MNHTDLALQRAVSEASPADSTGAVIRQGRAGLGLPMACMAVCVTLAAGAAQAQRPPAAASQFPVKPLRMIVPFPPGGGNDIVGRAVAQRMSEVVGEQVVVDNRPGAGGELGATLAAQASPDGYTMLLGSVGMLAHNPALKPNLKYYPPRDFAPVTLLVTSPMVVAVNPALPIKSVQDLIERAKANPDKLSFASAGTGSSLHMTGELFLRATGTRMLHVPYKGSGPAMVDLMGGRVDLIFSTMPPALVQVRNGKLRAIAVTTTARASVLPDVPTVAESGVKGFEVSNWQGIVVPAKTPASIVKTLHAQLTRTMKLPETIEALARQGLDPAVGTPEEFGALIKREIATYTELAKAADIKLD